MGSPVPARYRKLPDPRVMAVDVLAALVAELPRSMYRRKAQERLNASPFIVGPALRWLEDHRYIERDPIYRGAWFPTPAGIAADALGTLEVAS